MQIKTTMRYPCTPVRMATSLKSTNNSAGKDVGMKTGTTTVKTSMEFHKKKKKNCVQLPFDQTPLLGIYVKNPKTLI